MNIYKIPNPVDVYILLSLRQRYLINQMNVFDNIRDLVIDPTKILNEHQFHFANIKKLELENKDTDRPVHVTVHYCGLI
jgi:hypothetical protein